MTIRFGPGARFGDLVIERELGHGAFAVVYLARDTKLQRQVALKVLAVSSLSQSGEDRGRLLEEARTVAGLRSPHIVPLLRLHDVGEGGFALEMEYMDGGSLADLLEHRPTLPPDEAIRLASSVLEALEVAHAQGIVHCDVKPENVLLTSRGEVRLADFGLGQRISEASLSVEHQGHIRGTPHYMSPEVVGGEKPTVASDVWSVGVLLYRMLAGRLPFEGRTLPALFYAIHNDEPEPLSAHDFPRLAALVARCLAKDPALRPASAAAVRGELVGAPAARAPAPSPSPRSSSSRATAPALGREAELATLDRVRAEAEAGRGSGAILLGEAGVGKSALVREASRRAVARGIRWIEATLTPLGGLQQPLLAATRRLLLSESGTGSLTELVTSSRFGAAAPLLRGLLTEDAFDLQGRQQFVWAIEHLLRGFAVERPAMLVVEDLHFADAEDLRALGDLVRRLSDARVGVLFAYRTNDPSASQDLRASAPAFQELAAVPGIVSLSVGPLPEQALHELVLRETGATRVSSDVMERVHEQSEGNALFALEILRHLIAQEAIAVRSGQLSAGPRWNEAELPQKLADLVSVRLQRLTQEQRDVLDAAAVDGVTFDGAVLATILDLGLLRTLRELQRITREHALLTPLKHGFRFAHAMFRDVIYRELSPDLRRTYHRALAEHLEADGAGRADPERLGTHWHQAGEAARAAPHLRAAALASARRQDYSRALRLAERAGVHAGETDARAVADTAELRFALAGCLSDVGRATEADRHVAEVRDAAERLGDATLRLRARVRLSSQALVTKGIPGLEPKVLEDAVATLPVGYEAARAAYLLGYLHRTSGDDALAERWLLESDALFERANLGHMRGQVLHLLGVVAQRRGELELAASRFDEAAKIKTAHGRPTDAAVSRILACVTAVEQGRLDGTVGLMERAIHELRVSGAEDRAAHASVFLANVHAALGDFGRAEQILRSSVSVLSADRLLYGRMEALNALGDVLASRGKHEEAEAALTEAESLAERGRDDSARAEARAQLSRALALAKQPAAALPHLERAIGLLPRASATARALVLTLLGLACFYDPRLGDAAASALRGVDGLITQPLDSVASLLLRRALEETDSGKRESERMFLAQVSKRPPGPRRHELQAVARELTPRTA